MDYYTPLPVEVRAWQQAKLPVAMGGMGLRGAEDHALAAYAASILASQPLSRTLLNQGDEPEQVLPQQVLAGPSAALGEEA